MVVLFTVRLAVSLKEVFGADFLLTVSTHKVFRMPRPTHCCHHLASDGFLAGSTNTFGDSLDTQSVEV